MRHAACLFLKRSQPKGLRAMKTLQRMMAVLAAVAVMAILVPGCNTVRGAGRDIQKGGQAVVKAADKTQQGTRRAVHGR
jgi:predicted small secreted protein